MPRTNALAYNVGTTMLSKKKFNNIATRTLLGALTLSKTTLRITALGITIKMHVSASSAITLSNVMLNVALSVL